MTGGCAPGALVDQDHIEAPALGKGDDIIRIRLTEARDEEVGSFDPGRTLSPHASRTGARQTGRALEAFDGRLKLRAGAGDDPDAGRLDAKPLLRLREEARSLERPQIRAGILEVLQRDHTLVLALSNHRLHLIDQAGDALLGRQPVVVEADPGDPVIVKRVQRGLLADHLLPAGEVDGDIVVAVAVAVVAELDLELLSAAIAIHPDANGPAPAEVQRHWEAARDEGPPGVIPALAGRRIPRRRLALAHGIGDRLEGMAAPLVVPVARPARYGTRANIDLRGHHCRSETLVVAGVDRRGHGLEALHRQAEELEALHRARYRKLGDFQPGKPGSLRHRQAHVALLAEANEQLLALARHRGRHERALGCGDLERRGRVGRGEIRPAFREQRDDPAAVIQGQRRAAQPERGIAPAERRETESEDDQHQQSRSHQQTSWCGLVAGSQRVPLLAAGPRSPPPRGKQPEERYQRLQSEVTHRGQPRILARSLPARVSRRPYWAARAPRASGPARSGTLLEARVRSGHSPSRCDG